MTNLFGVHVPDAVIIDWKRPTTAAEGRAICRELIAGMREIDGIAGVHIMAPARGARSDCADAGGKMRGRPCSGTSRF
jgi:hypothetical protein